MPTPKSSSRWQRFDAWLRRHPIVILITALSFVLSSILTIVGAGDSVRRWFRSTFFWRDAEYEKLENLHAGYALDKFREELGAPKLKEPIEKSNYTAYTFEGRGYWVQVIADPFGVAESYAVTACSRDFRPSFSFGQESSTPGRVVLNKSTFASVLNDFFKGEIKARSAFTSNSYVFEVYYGGNGGAYKTYAWGLNDSCEGSPGDAWRSWGFRSNINGRTVPVNRSDKTLLKLMSTTTVNTYAETAPFIKGKEFTKLFPEQVGVDRILIRTT